MNCLNCKNNIAKDRTGYVICIPSINGECNIKLNETEEKQCDKEIAKDGNFR